MYKHILALAALVAASGYFMQSLAPANAQSFVPSVAGGVSPWVNFTGTTIGTGETTIYTVPSDQYLVVTMAIISSGAVDLYEDTTLKVEGYSGATTGSVGLADGQGHLTLEPGANFILNNTSGSSGTQRYYYIEGYLAPQ